MLSTSAQRSDTYTIPVGSFSAPEQFSQADLSTAYPTPPRSILEGDPNSVEVKAILRSLRRPF